MRKIKRDFEFDLIQEAILRDCVVQTFWQPYIQKHYGAVVESIDDKATQLKGIDFTVRYPYTTLFHNVDLKAQANNYINKPTNTFCLEMSYFKDGKEKLGWYLRKDLETTDYLLMWIQKSKYEMVDYLDYQNHIRKRKMINLPENVYEYQLMMVNVERIHQWLSENKLTDRTCWEVNKYIRSAYGSKVLKSHSQDNNLRLYFDFNTHELSMDKPTHFNYVHFTSTAYGEKAEAPINLVVNKSFWKELASAEYIVRPREADPITVLKEHSTKMRKTA